MSRGSPKIVTGKHILNAEELIVLHQHGYPAIKANAPLGPNTKYLCRVKSASGVLRTENYYGQEIEVDAS